MDGETGYKYVRAKFSNALDSLSEADIEIRDVKTEQLYSVEKVALSTDGYTADITIAGDASVSGTTFLQPSTIYSCTIDADGATSTLEFQLPAVWSDMLVISADMEKNKITVWGPVRKSSYDGMPTMTLNVGDAYDENLGALVGHTVVVGIDADNNITKLKVNDGEVAFGYVTAKDGDNDNQFTSSKDYFQTASGDKYFLSTDETSTTNYSISVSAKNDGAASYISGGSIAKNKNFEYGKLILNPNGTVSAAVLWEAFDDYIFATTTEGSVAKETKDNSKDFKGYTVIQEDTFDYIDPTDISEGDIIYFDSDDKLAFVYNESVEGTLENVYEDKLEIDGTKYNFIVWREGFDHILPGAKNAEYYDAANDTYEKVTEAWAKTLDKTEPVTIFLDTKGDGVLVDGEVGETVTHSKEYIVTQSPKVYVNGLTTMIDMSVSDGTAITLHIPLADLEMINGNKYGSTTLQDGTGAALAPAAIPAGGKYEFKIVDGDGKKTGVNALGKTVVNLVNGADPVVPATTFQQGSLIDVIYNDDETKVTGLKLKNGQNPAGITMLVDNDVEFKAGLTSIKTSNGSLTLSDSTKVYVLTGTRLANNELENDTEDDAATGQFKEASDNKVKAYDYSDFDQNTQAGTYKLSRYTAMKTTTAEPAKEAAGAGNGYTVGSLVRFFADKTTAKAVIIDNRGVNVALGTDATYGKPGTLDATGDMPGEQVFKTAKTETKVLGVAKSTEYQLNSDGATPQLASITIITAAGEVTLDDLDAKIDTDQNAKNKIVLAELDATGKVTKLNEFAEATGAAAVEQVNFGGKGASTGATETLKVTSTAGFYNVKTDSDCLVLKWSGSSYSESTIGDINRDTDYVGIKFYTTQLNGTDVKAKVIVATKSVTGAGLLPVATTVGSISAINSANLSASTIAITGAVDSGTIYLSDDTTIGDADDIAVGTFTAAGVATLSADVEGLVGGTAYYTVLVPDTATVYSSVISTGTTAAAAATATYVGTTATTKVAGKTATATGAMTNVVGGDGSKIAVTTTPATLYVFDQYSNLVKSKAATTDLTATGTNVTADDYDWSTGADGKLVIKGKNDNTAATNDVLTIAGCAITVTVTAGV